jgi:hypothetical protein
MLNLTRKYQIWISKSFKFAKFESMVIDGYHICIGYLRITVKRYY